MQNIWMKEKQDEYWLVNLMLSSRGAYQNFGEKDLFIFVDLVTLEHPEITVYTVCLLLKKDFLFICWKLNYWGHFLYEHKYLASSFEMFHHRLADVCCNKFNAKCLSILSHQPYLVWLNQTWVRFFISCGWLAQVWISSNHRAQTSRPNPGWTGGLVLLSNKHGALCGRNRIQPQSTLTAENTTSLWTNPDSAATYVHHITTKNTSAWVVVGNCGVMRRCAVSYRSGLITSTKSCLSIFKWLVLVVLPACLTVPITGVCLHSDQLRGNCT